MKFIKILLLSITLTILNLSFVYAAPVVKDVPPGASCKTYMSYRALTKKSSPQYALQQLAETDNLGIRTVNGRYMVAVGSYYSTTMGTPIDVVLDTGVILPCIVGDGKADCHTNATHQLGLRGDAIEFIVDPNLLPPEMKGRGDCSFIPYFSGNVVQIIVQDSMDISAMAPSSLFEDTII